MKTKMQGLNYSNISENHIVCFNVLMRLQIMCVCGRGATTQIQNEISQKLNCAIMKKNAKV